MQDDLRRISQALDMPLSWLLWIALAGFVSLVAALGSRNWMVAGVAAGFGVVISLIGVRAAIRPPRPFHLENFESTPGITTSRRLGLFYVAAGLAWAMIALLAAKGS